VALADTYFDTFIHAGTDEFVKLAYVIGLIGDT
jgi:hypothetical protein